MREPGRARWRRAARSPLFLAACLALAALVGAGLLADLVAPYSPTAVDAPQVFRGPSASHPFGTDRFGRDVLSRILFGIRVSLGIAGASILAAVGVGGVLGLLAGLGRAAVLVRHILPNALSPVIVQTAVCLSYAILIESALSYLGVGVQPPAPSWGAILNEGKEFLALAPWVSLFPGGAIVLAVLAFNIIGDGLRDALDPRAEVR